MILVWVNLAQDFDEFARLGRLGLLLDRCHRDDISLAFGLLRRATDLGDILS